MTHVGAIITLIILALYATLAWLWSHRPSVEEDVYGVVRGRDGMWQVRRWTGRKYVKVKEFETQREAWKYIRSI